jgi:Uma2 family endonuclease
MLTLPRQLSGALRLTPAQFAELCEANPEAVLELEPDGRLVTMASTGGTTGVAGRTRAALHNCSTDAGSMACAARLLRQHGTE